MARRRPICPQCGEKISREDEENEYVTRCCECGVMMHTSCAIEIEDNFFDIKDYCNECYEDLEHREDNSDIPGDDGKHNLFGY